MQHVQWHAISRKTFNALSKLPNRRGAFALVASTRVWLWVCNRTVQAPASPMTDACLTALASTRARAVASLTRFVMALSS
ncbi:hypothetical protein [Xanthomonas campestris]|uniref:hypothetical protein n=1 Tax=Xanthomonas campestris TaxID=339 RepID=UPI002B2221F7|nr:hypothetical protein [Xanthomonas campestris]MEA9653980.1 hypothetical protein [Xanthomonas campestris pv. raphani]